MPGIFLILGKLINKLKHHLRPRQSVLYDQVVANRNKTELRHESSFSTEYTEPLQPIGSHPSKPRSDEYQSVDRKNGEEFKILGWLHYWEQLIIGLACAINNVSFFVFMSSLGALPWLALTNEKQASASTGQWEARCWHPVKPFCDVVSARRCRWTDGVPPLSPQNIINYTSQLHQYNRRKT